MDIDIYTNSTMHQQLEYNNAWWLLQTIKACKTHTVWKACSYWTEQQRRKKTSRHNQRHSFLRAKNAKSHRVKPGRLLFSPAGVSRETFLLFGRVQYSEVHSSAALRCDNNKQHGDLAVGPTFWRFVDVCYSVWTFSNRPAIITGVVPNSRNVLALPAHQ